MKEYGKIRHLSNNLTNIFQQRNHESLSSKPEKLTLICIFNKMLEMCLLGEPTNKSWDVE